MINKYTKHFVLVLFIAIMVFTGCSKSNMDLQTTPNIQLNDNCMESNGLVSNIDYTSYIKDDIVYIYGQPHYIPKETDITEVDLSKWEHLIKNSTAMKNIPNNSYQDGYNNFLENIIILINAGFITFNNEQNNKPFIKKIRVLMKMIENWNLNAVYKKGFNDIAKHVDLWISSEDGKTVVMKYLGLTQFMLEHGQLLSNEMMFQNYFDCVVDCATIMIANKLTALICVVAIAATGGLGGTVCSAYVLASVLWCSGMCLGYTNY